MFLIKPFHYYKICGYY